MGKTVVLPLGSLLVQCIRIGDLNPVNVTTESSIRYAGCSLLQAESAQENSSTQSSTNDDGSTSPNGTKKDFRSMLSISRSKCRKKADILDGQSSRVPSRITTTRDWDVGDDGIETIHANTLPDNENSDDKDVSKEAEAASTNAASETRLRDDVRREGFSMDAAMHEMTVDAYLDPVQPIAQESELKEVAQDVVRQLKTVNIVARPTSEERKDSEEQKDMDDLVSSRVEDSSRTGEADKDEGAKISSDQEGNSVARPSTKVMPIDAPASSTGSRDSDIDSQLEHPKRAHGTCKNWWSRQTRGKKLAIGFGSAVATGLLVGGITYGATSGSDDSNSVSAIIYETSNPTARPTNFPSVHPTANPTDIPTNVPSKSPTNIPSEAPTDVPSHIPTNNPSESPTIFPSASPTNIPSQGPTGVPSHIPTNNPSESPTYLPSTSPTTIPSQGPTGFPSESPTNIPSESPTNFPSASPTSIPSQGPTGVPSRVPTSNPSESPTYVPSVDPTANPTEVPTAGPTTHPTEAPSSTPTGNPSSAPTTTPSEQPTGVPSVSPTSVPTAVPTPVPTAVPTAVPTFVGDLIVSDGSFVFEGKIVIGDLTVASDVYNINISESFPNLREIQGSITIENTFIEGIVFPELVEVRNGYIHISDNSVLSSVAFEKLVSVEDSSQDDRMLSNLNPPDQMFRRLSSESSITIGGMTISNNPTLNSVHFPELGTIYSTLRISNNENLHTAQFPVLSTIGADLVVLNNPAMSVFAISPDHSVGGSIEFPPEKKDVSFSSVNDRPMISENLVGNLIVEAGFVGEFDGSVLLPYLHTIEGDIIIEGSGVESVSLPTLQTIQDGHISISDNQQLLSVEFPTLAAVEGGNLPNISMHNNIWINLVSIPQLDSLDGNFVIDGTNDLESLDLGDLELIGGDLLVSSSRDVLDALALGHDYTVGGSIDLPSVHRYIGDVTLKPQPSYTFVREEIVGNVVVEEAFEGSLDASVELPGLTKIDGDLYIQGTSATSVSFPDLTAVRGGSIIATDNGILAEVDFQNLATIVVSVESGPGHSRRRLSNSPESNLRILNNGVLSVINLEKFVNATDVSISHNNALQNLDLPNFQSCSGDFVVHDNEALQTIEVSNLEGTGGNFEISSNTALASVDLEKFSVASAVEISGNDVLEAVGMSSFQHCEGDVVLSNNQALQDISIPRLTKVSGDLIIGGSVELEEADFGSITRIDGDLSITQNPHSRFIDLSNLTHVVGTVTIDYLSAVDLVSWPSEFYHRLQLYCGAVYGDMLPCSTDDVLQALQFACGIYYQEVTACDEDIELTNFCKIITCESTSANVNISPLYPGEIIQPLVRQVGGISFSDSTPLLYFGRLQTISHDVTFHHTELSELHLPALQSIVGSISIFNNTDLALINTPSLQTVSGTVSITSNPSLKHVDFSQLATNGDLATNVDVSDNNEQIKIIFSSTLQIKETIELQKVPSYNGQITLANIDISQVTDLSYLYSEEQCFSDESFSADLSDLDVSNVVNMEYMFHEVPYASGVSVDLSTWDVSRVTDMQYMFGCSCSTCSETWGVSYYAMSSWDVSRVTNMKYMFASRKTFRADLSDWDVSKVTDMDTMFMHTWRFDSDISRWDVSKVTDMSHMLASSSRFEWDLSPWDVSKVVDMAMLFGDYTPARDIPLCGTWKNNQAAEVAAGYDYLRLSSSDCTSNFYPNAPNVSTFQPCN